MCYHGVMVERDCSQQQWFWCVGKQAVDGGSLAIRNKYP